jgi:hypothetical protein
VRSRIREAVADASISSAASLFADHHVVGPVGVRMAVQGGAQDEQFAITMGEERTAEEPTSSWSADKRGCALRHGSQDTRI